MSILPSIFEKKPRQADPDFVNPVTTELHSHLIPGIDDGTETIAQSVEILSELKTMGYRKVITTPHVMGDFYKNGPFNILPGLETLRDAFADQKIDIQVHAAAEYMVDDLFEEKITNKALLTFGDNCVLIELPFSNEPPVFSKVLFDLQINGYQPVLAHPERYGFLARQPKRYEEMAESGILLQLNVFSLLGYYSPEVRKTAEFLIDKKLIRLIGSDIHGLRHVPVFKDAVATKYYQKACELNLLNNTL